MPRASHQQTVSRQWAILKLLPKRALGITASQLKAALESEGFVVTKRTVERDLVELSRNFPLVTTPGAPPIGWRWKEGSQLDIAGVDLLDAISLTMVADLLRQMLPRAMQRAVEGRFEQAKQKLSSLKGNPVAGWSDLARYVPAGLNLLPPSIDVSVLNAVEESLLGQRQLDVKYRSASSNVIREFTMHPLAILSHGSTPYLVSTLGEGTEIYQYPLQRFDEAVVSEGPAWRPPGFTIDGFISGGGAYFGDGNLIILKAVVSEHLAGILTETPLGEGQTLSEDDYAWILEVPVRETWQLHFWILSQGERIEVLEPESVRSHIVSTLEKALSSYKTRELSCP